MINKEYNLKKSKIEITLDDNMFYLKTPNKTYYAKYDFNIEQTPEHHIDLMMYILFYDLEENKRFKYDNGVEVDMPYFGEKVFESKGTNKSLLCFSGGYDSTAVKLLIPDTVPIYLERDYDPVYGNNQKQIIKDIGSHIVLNNIEQFRIEYKGRPGFNTGNGYVGLLIPYLTKYDADTIFGGAVFDDIGFNYSETLKCPENINIYGRTLNSFKWFKNGGITLAYPVAGISEVLTTKIVNDSKFKDTVCSCHVPCDNNHCYECYKCFRKAQIIGEENKLTEKCIRKTESIFNRRPLKMALSTIYAVQKGNIKNDVFNKFKNIDISFAEKCSGRHQSFYNTDYIKSYMEEIFSKMGIHQMDKNDYIKIKNFVDKVNEIQNKYIK